MARKGTEWVQFKLRIREGLRREIEREAKKKARSANNEASERLEKSFEAERETKAVGQRDDLIALLLGGGENADFLHSIAFILRARPNWSDDADARRQMVEEIKNELDTRYLVESVQ